MARSKPLPVALSEEQHAYLESKGKKAEYLRKLLIIDMYKEEERGSSDSAETTVLSTRFIGRYKSLENK